MKLGIYIVDKYETSTLVPDVERHTWFLVIAESTQQARERIETNYFERVGDIGRLGDYSPGILGHQMVSLLEGQARNYVLKEERTA